MIAGPLGCGAGAILGTTALAAVIAYNTVPVVKRAVDAVATVAPRGEKIYVTYERLNESTNQYNCGRVSGFGDPDDIARRGSVLTASRASDRRGVLDHTRCRAKRVTVLYEASLNKKTTHIPILGGRNCPSPSGRRLLCGLRIKWRLIGGASPYLCMCGFAVWRSCRHKNWHGSRYGKCRL